MSDAHSVNRNTDATGAATARAKQQDASQPDEREARLAELRRRYQKGAYSVDPAKVSASLIEEHLRK